MSFLQTLLMNPSIIQSGGGGEARPVLAQQRAPPVALQHPRPPRPRSEEVLREVLRRIHRPRLHPAAPVHPPQGKHTFRGVPSWIKSGI